MRHTFFLCSALVGMFCFSGCYNTNQSKDAAAQIALADKAQSDKAAEDLAKLERDKIAAEQDARERENEAQAQAEKERIKTNIESVLQEDAKAPVGADTVVEIVHRMRDIDISGCPEDFRVAYVAHIHAWEAMREVERNAIAFKKESNADGVLVETFVRGMLGDPLGKVNELAAAQTQLQRDYQSARSEIKETFNRVEELTARYGANLPK